MVMFLQNVNDSLLPSLKAMATKAVDGLSITDLPQSAQQSQQQQQQSLSVQQQQLQTATTQQPTVPVGSSNISQAGKQWKQSHTNYFLNIFLTLLNTQHSRILRM